MDLKFFINEKVYVIEYTNPKRKLRFKKDIILLLLRILLYREFSYFYCSVHRGSEYSLPFDSKDIRDKYVQFCFYELWQKQSDEQSMDFINIDANFNRFLST